MRNRRRFSPALATSAALLLAGLVTASAGPGVDKARMGYYTNVELTTHEGKKVRFYDDLIKGKIVLFNMMYTNCGDICPGMTHNLVEVQRILGDRIGRDIFMYSMTLQPQFDDAEALAAYAKENGVGPGWLFLTGTEADMEMLRRRLGFVDLVPQVDSDLFQHIGVVRMGNEPIDRWATSPALSDPEVIVDTVLRLERASEPVIPVGRGRLAMEALEAKGHSGHHHHNK